MSAGPLPEPMEGLGHLLIASQRLRPFVQNGQVGLIGKNPVTIAAANLAHNVQFPQRLNGAGNGGIADTCSRDQVRKLRFLLITIGLGRR